MKTAAQTPEEYIAELPAERQEAISTLRSVIRRNLPNGYEEGMAFGMISYHVPLDRLPDTYNGQPLTYAGLANQKNHVALYLMNVYGDEDTRDWFTGRWAASGKQLDMGKSCVRIRQMEEVPLDLIGEVIARTPVDRYVAHYQAARGG